MFQTAWQPLSEDYESWLYRRPEYCVEYRHSEGNPERLPDLAAELVPYSLSHLVCLRRHPAAERIKSDTPPSRFTTLLAFTAPQKYRFSLRLDCGISIADT